MFAVVSLLEDVLLQVRVDWEVDRRKGDIAEQTRRCTLVETDQAQLPDDVDGAFRYGTLDLGSLALHLETNLAAKIASNIG